MTRRSPPRPPPVVDPGWPALDLTPGRRARRAPEPIVGCRGRWRAPEAAGSGRRSSRRRAVQLTDRRPRSRPTTRRSAQAHHRRHAPVDHPVAAAPWLARIRRCATTRRPAVGSTDRGAARASSSTPRQLGQTEALPPYSSGRGYRASRPANSSQKGQVSDSASSRPGHLRRHGSRSTGAPCVAVLVSSPMPIALPSTLYLERRTPGPASRAMRRPAGPEAVPRNWNKLRRRTAPEPTGAARRAHPVTGLSAKMWSRWSIDTTCHRQARMTTAASTSWVLPLSAQSWIMIEGSGDAAKAHRGEEPRVSPRERARSSR